jgi:hypothetical protein
VCTVVVRWAPGAPVQVLALRDELVGRDFDDPGTWWEDHPGTVGGRDRSAGGTWCATHVASGVTGLVLNRPQRPQAAEGAPSRGVLPLLAVRHRARWSAEVALEGMASFALLLAEPGALTSWSYDGEQLLREELPPGTHMVTSGGAEDGKAVRHLAAFAAGHFPDAWLEQLRSTAPSADPASLVVRGEHDGRVFATVFGQLFSAVPGHLELSWAREPWGDHAWRSASWDS